MAPFFAATFTNRILKIASLLGFVLLSNAVWAEAFVLARVSKSPSKHLAQLAPMSEHLAAELTGFGFTEGQVRVASNIEELQDWVENGKVHWVTDTLMIASVLVSESGAIPVLRKLKKGVREYRSYIFVRKDSGITSIADLKGKSIAFEDPYSFSGFFVPSILIRTAGLGLKEMRDRDDLPAQNQVGYQFVQTELNISQWVHKGLISAGALNDNDWNSKKRMPPAFREDLQVIAQSEPFPRALELATPALHPEAVEIVAEELLNLRYSDAAWLLKKYEKTTGFERVDAEIDRAIEFVLAGRSLVP